MRPRRPSRWSWLDAAVRHIDARRSTGSLEVITGVGRGSLPADLLALTRLERIDYCDAYTAATSAAGRLSPERWARAILEDAPLSRRSAYRLWRSLGLELGPVSSPDHVQGWEIGAAGDDWIRLLTRSWYMAAEAVFRRDHDQVSVALFLHFRNPVAPLVWLPVGVAHRRAVPVMLRQAVAAQEARTE